MASNRLTTGIGFSTKSDAVGAGKEAAEMAREHLPVMYPARLAIVFGSSWFDQALLVQSIHATIGPVPIIGCSTAGEMISESPLSHSCVVLILGSEAKIAGIGCGQLADSNPRFAGQQAAHSAAQSMKGQSRSGFLTFSDGLIDCHSDVIRGIQEVLGTNALIVGAMAGDDLRFYKTHQYFNNRALTHSVVGVLFSNPVHLGIGFKHGFFPISKPHRITKAKARTLQQLDNRPAALVYEEYFDKPVIQRMSLEPLTRSSIAFPLGIQTNEASDNWLLRNVVSFASDGSLRCNGEIPENGSLQLMMGSRQMAIDAAFCAAKEAVQSLNFVSCVLLFDSALRRTLLGPQHTLLEFEKIREAVGPNIPIIGCCTYGEHASLQQDSAEEKLSSQTGSVLALALGNR